MNNFYTNVSVASSKILYRGVENGKRVKHKLDYSPTLFVSTQDKSVYKTVRNEYVKPIRLGDIKEARDFIKQYDGVSGFNIYGNQKFEYTFIADEHTGHVEWDKEHIKICNLDIEVGSENGFPEPDTANEPITAITYKIDNNYIVYGCGDYVPHRNDITYHQCTDEIDLLKSFIMNFSFDHPDIITGWNVKFFDIPYLINRITKVLGESFAKRMSPWGHYHKRTVFIMGHDQECYVVSGYAILDYMELYRKFVTVSKESFSLNFICHDELGERKLSYDGTLHSLYKRDFQKFVEYNIRDVELVEKLEDKLKLIELALTLAYDSKSNYEDVFMQTRMWDSLIFNHLKKEKIVLPQIKTNTKDNQYVGAYVKSPEKGLYHWIASFDLNSLYPHLIMQWNISPDTLIEPSEYNDQLQSFLSTQDISVDTLLKKKIDTAILKENNVTLTPNGQFFQRNKRGFLPKMMEEMYNDRLVYKEKALTAKKELEQKTDPAERTEIEKRIARYHNLQLAKKVSLNSAYGALGSPFFRFYDVRQAAAITTAGQLAIQWIERKLNDFLNKVLGTDNKDYVIASDTDSVYLNLNELVRRTFTSSHDSSSTKQIIAFLDKSCETIIQPFIDKSYEELAGYINALEQKMQMKREALADRGIWTAKKRYVLNVHNSEGIEYTKPKIKVTGLEMIKSTTPTACREKLWDALDIIMNKDEKTMLSFISNFRKDFGSIPVENIAFPRGVNNIDKFSDSKTMFKPGTPIHVRGSIIYNHLLKKCDLHTYPSIKEGEKIKYVYLREPNTTRGNIISFPNVLPKEFGLNNYIDRDIQFEKSFLDPLKVLLDIIDWKVEEKNTLEAFFA